MKKSRSWKGRRRHLFVESLIMAIVIALFGIVLMLYDRSSRKREEIGDAGSWSNNLTETSGLEIKFLLNNRVYSCSDQLMTYLLIGTDASGQNPEAVRGSNGDLADFLALIIIDKDTNKYGIIQIDRDTVKDVPILDENGEEIGTSLEQICTAHWYGQNEEQRNTNTVNAVSCIMGGIPIDGYYCINMKDIPLINHAVGGVVVIIEEDLRSLDPAMEEGSSIRLTDEQAEKFVRARMFVGDGTNISRMRRQRQYMEKMYEHVSTQMLENERYINDLYRELKGILETDQPDRTVSEIAAKVYECENVGILTLDGESTRGQKLDDGQTHSEFYVDEVSIIENLGKIITLQDVTDEVITEEDMELLQQDFPEDEEIPLK